MQYFKMEQYKKTGDSVRSRVVVVVTRTHRHDLAANSFVLGPLADARRQTLV